jgi:hypothetical protein
MGMFNYVKFEMKCPNCGTIVNTFQTKDDYNYSLFLKEVEFWEVNNFYQSCSGCGAWIEFNRKIEFNKKIKKVSIKEYEMTVEKKK